MGMAAMQKQLANSLVNAPSHTARISSRRGSLHTHARASFNVSNSSDSARNSSAITIIVLQILKVKASLNAVAKQPARDIDSEAINAQIKENLRSMRMLALVMPFAAVSGSTDTFFIITKAVASFIKVRLEHVATGSSFDIGDCLHLSNIV